MLVSKFDGTEARRETMPWKMVHAAAAATLHRYRAKVTAER
jgi:hypothetical protein